MSNYRDVGRFRFYASPRDSGQVPGDWYEVEDEEVVVIRNLELLAQLTLAEPQGRWLHIFQHGPGNYDIHFFRNSKTREVYAVKRRLRNEEFLEWNWEEWEEFMRYNSGSA